MLDRCGERITCSFPEKCANRAETAGPAWHLGTTTQIKADGCLLAALEESAMHFSRIKGRKPPRHATGALSRISRLALLLCGLFGIACAMLVATGTLAKPNAA